MPGQEIAKKQRMKAKQKKAEELARQKEEEKMETEAEEKRRVDAKLEKRAALARHDEEIETQQKTRAVVSSPSGAPSDPGKGKTTSLSGSSLTAISRQMAKKSNKARPSTATRKQKRASKPTATDRLSSYIKTKPKGIKKVSPVFALIQNEKTVAEGRKLMRLEVETRACSDELASIMGRKLQLEKSIKQEERLMTFNRAKIDEVEATIRSKWNIFFNLSTSSGKELDAELNAMDAEEEAKLEKELKEKEEKLSKEAEEKLDGDESSDSPDGSQGQSDGVDDVESAKAIVSLHGGDGEVDNGNESVGSEEGAEDEDGVNDEDDSNAADGGNEDVDGKDGGKGDGQLTEKKEPSTLPELIESCSEFLSGDPAKYLDWLLSEKIKNIVDLGAEVIMDIDRMAKGNGDVGISPESEGQFSSAVLDAVFPHCKVSDADVESPVDREKRLEEEDIKEKAATAKKIAEEGGLKALKKRKGKRYNEVTEAKGRINRLKKSTLRAKQSIVDQKRQLKDVTPLLAPKVKELAAFRADIAAIKGDDMAEDVHFNINKSRDERGFTFLIVAAQNDDFFTAKVCFELRADPHVTSPEGLTASDYSSFFGFERVTNLIAQHGGSASEALSGAWADLQSMVPQSKETAKSWDDTLQIAETAALPAESLMELPESCEADEAKKMPLLSPDEIRSRDVTCFESRLLDPNINPDQVQRVVLLDRTVYHWSLSTDLLSRRKFVHVLEGLKPAAVRKPSVSETKVHRRAVVGATTTYEILAARFEDSSGEEMAVLFTPFVSGEVDGMSSIGVLVWAVVPESSSSLYKTLVANVEFMRHKVMLDDRFLGHKEAVLELGKDMHLLDLHSTSIWTTSAMELFILNVDDGDLDRIHDQGFSAKKRVVYSEEQVNRKIFRSTKAEAREDEDILAGERLDKSSHIAGGAGTGKTLLMIKKVSREEESCRVLVVSRLPRLVSIIKTAVEESRGEKGIGNLSFSTYDDLMHLLSRRVVPDSDAEYQSFIQFERIRYDSEEPNISFYQKFVAGHLNDTERKQMANNLIEPLTLWHAIVVIKSSAKCADTKQPLSLDDYVALPLSFGLSEDQRRLCYKLFLVYEHWRSREGYWDEMDRVLYVFKWGPSVFRDDCYISWADRVNKFGENDLLNDDGEPLYPFFFDVVCADEAQDFTETELFLFAKMSSSVRSLFLSADPAQSVELGVKMRDGTVNDVFHSLIKGGKHSKVKDVLQLIQLRTNHRTHAQNLAIGQAIRRILARSFKVPLSEETALIDGTLPKLMCVSEVKELAATTTFKGGNIVFIAPDEVVPLLRSKFNELGIMNDLFGVREAKGLEFDACALLGFLGYMEDRGSAEEWVNALRWLSSSTTLANTDSTGEVVNGVMLADCDYRLSAPNVSDEAMMLYTALTRARNHLYLIEVSERLTEAGEARRGKRERKGVGMVSFALRTFEELGLAKRVTSIDEGHVEMTAAQHKARGVLYVTQALTMSRDNKSVSAIKEKMSDAMFRFRPNQGNDKDLLDKAEKHLAAIVQKHSLFRFAKDHFLVKGEYNLEGRFTEVLQFEQRVSKFFARYLCDSFLAEEVHDMRQLLEEIVDGTPYARHFEGVFATIRRLE